MIVKPLVLFELPIDSRAELKGFLDSIHGRNLLQAWSLLTPETASHSVEQAALTGQLRKGYEKAIEDLLAMIVPQNGEVIGTPATEYPDLNDDEAWKKETTVKESDPV